LEEIYYNNANENIVQINPNRNPLKTIPTFDILDYVEQLEDRSNMYTLPSDYSVPLFNGSAVSKGTFTEALNHIFEKSNMTQGNRLDFLSLLQNTFNGNVNIPIIVNDKYKYNDDEYKYNDKYKYNLLLLTTINYY